MQLGMIGLGRMGGNMVKRLMRDGHDCVVYDVHQENVGRFVDEGATGAASLEDLAEKLTAPRAVWLMIPIAHVDEVIGALAPLLDAGDVVIDGGNSHYRHAIRRSRRLAERDVHYMDVGTSGGVWGLERGYCLMVGGEADDVQRLDPVLRSLAPGRDAAAPTPGRERRGGTAEEGYLHCGPHGAGHFVKMVHNGIEYGVMAAYAEGFQILQAADLGAREDDPEAALLSDAGLYRYDFDLPDVAEVWRRGSVIGSWLLDLTAAALARSPGLADFGGRVSDSGEGRWTVQAAVEQGVPAHVLTAALYERFASRGRADFANRVLSAMRYEFGGHEEKED